MLFAQLQNVPSESLKNWMLILAGLLAIAYYGKNVLGLGKQRREITFEFTPASKEDFDRHVNQNANEHAQMFQKIGGVERGANSRMNELSSEWRKFADEKFFELTESSDRGREKLHDRINDVLQAVSELRGTVTEMRKKP